MNAIPPLFSWLASTLLPLGALWLLFRGVLRAEQCFGYNRALLLLAPVVTVVLPLLPHPEWPEWLSSTATSGSNPVAILLPTLSATTGELAGVWPGWAWLMGLYLAGVVLGLVRLAYQAGHLYRATRRLPREVRPGYTLVYTGGQLPISSFGNTIFWDETADLTAAEASSVLRHELAHVQQGHTYDILWLELWRVVLWPNPFVHLLLPAVRLTHELLADRAAAQQPAPAVANATAGSYTVLLARLATRSLAGGQHSTLLQPFTFSFTLIRIAMLQNQIPVRRWKQWLALPVLAELLFVAGQSASAQSAPPPPMPTKGIPATPPTASGERKVYTYVEQMPQLPGGGSVLAITKAIQDKLVYPKLEKSAQMNGAVFASFIVEADGTVQDPNIIKGLSTPYDDAVLASIRQLPRFIPGKQNGRAVAVSFTVPVKFQLATDK